METKKSKLESKVGTAGQSAARVWLVTVMIVALKSFVFLPHPTWSISNLLYLF